MGDKQSRTKRGAGKEATDTKEPDQVELDGSDTSNGAETNNTSNGAASVSDGAQNSTKLLQSSQQSSSPITYNGAYVGVSEGFEKHAIQSSGRPAGRSLSPTMSSRRSSSSDDVLPKVETPAKEIKDDTEALKKSVRDPMKSDSKVNELDKSYRKEGGTERSSFLRKLGFDQSEKRQAAMNPSKLLLQQTNSEISSVISQLGAGSPPQQNNLAQVRKSSFNPSSSTVAPESRFTQILQQASQSQLKISTIDDQHSKTTISNTFTVENNVGSQKAMSAMERALHKHGKTEVVETSYFQDVTDQQQTLIGAHEEQKDDEIAKNQPIDERQFMDKIKNFNPNISVDNISQEELQQSDQEYEQLDEFGITQIEQINGEEDAAQADTLNRQEQTIQQNTEEAIIEEQQTEDDNQQQAAFRLDNESRDRAGDKLRKNLLSRLTYEKIWLTPMQKPKPYETAIIFDWDDTLLCTSFISPKGVYRDVDLGPVVMHHIKQLQHTTKQMLELAVKFGRVYIITNACEGWVEFSCNRFMPEVMPVLQKITIISARAKYEKLFPKEVPKWKLYAFLETQTELTKGNMKNVVALGDSMMEMDAAHHLAMKFQKALIKTVKFKEFPRPNELVKQLNLVISKFDDIINNSRNLTIRLEKKSSEQ